MRRNDADAGARRIGPRTLVGVGALTAVAALGAAVAPSAGVPDIRVLLGASLLAAVASIALALAGVGSPTLRVFIGSLAVVVTIGSAAILSGSWNWYAAQGALSQGEWSDAEAHLAQQGEVDSAMSIRLPQVGDRPGIRVGVYGIVVCSDTRLEIDWARALAGRGKLDEAWARLKATGERAQPEGYRDVALADIRTEILAGLLRIRSGG